MNKLFFLAIFSLGTASVLHAQNGNIPVNPVVTEYDVNMLSNSIMGKLIPGLKLTLKQQQQVTTVISAYLTQKENILPLITDDPPEYRKKRASLYSSLRSRLTSILLKDQMNKFIGMKPIPYDSINPLSQVFY